MSQSSLAAKIGELFEVVQRREAFLNVSETDHLILFYLILLVKCFIAGFGAKKCIPKNLTFIILTLNFLNLALVEKEWIGLFYNFSFTVVALLTQAILLFKKLPSPLNALSWYIACLELDYLFHFCLDVYVVVTLSVHIYRVYKNYHQDAILVFSCLFAAEFVSNHLIEPMDICNSLITLFFPVMLVTSFIPFNHGFLRLLTTVAAVSVWIFYKYNRTRVVDPLPTIGIPERYHNPAVERPEWHFNLSLQWGV